MSVLTTTTDLLDRIKVFLANKELRQLLTGGHLDTVAKRISQVERAVFEAGAATDEARATIFYTLFLRGSANLDLAQTANRRFNALTSLADFEACAQFIRRGGGAFQVGRYDVLPGPNTKYEFIQNFRVGLKQSYLRAKGYLANIHLLGRFLREPDWLLQHLNRRLKALEKYDFDLPDRISLTAFLENRTGASPKIDDLHVRFHPGPFILRFGGRDHDFSDIFRYIRISVDSKFYKNPNALKSGKTLYQQSALAIGDRMDEVLELMRRMEADNMDDFAEVMGDLLPVLFQHYIVIPPDVGTKTHPSGLSKSVRDALAEEFTADFMAHLDSLVGLTGFTPPGRVDKVKELAEAFAGEHFGGGACVLRHALRYDDVGGR